MPESVCLVGTMPPIKGVSDYCIEQSRALAEKTRVNFFGFKSIYPEFLYPGGSTKETERKVSLGGNVNVSNSLSWYNPFSWILAGLRSEGEVLHFHWWTYFLFPVFFTIAFLSKLRGKKVVITIHNVVSHETGFFDRLFSSILYFLPDAFIVHTEQNRRQLLENFRVGGKKIFVIPHGILSMHDTPVSRGIARKELGIPLNAEAVLFFGNIRDYKGVDDLIDAFREASKKRPNLFLVVAGKPWNKELENSLSIAGKEIARKKFFFDFVPSEKISYYFNAADLAVLPYRGFAAQSGAGNLALAFSKPLIVSDVGGLPELVLDRKAIFAAGNPRELAEKITQAFSEKSLLKKLSSDSSKLRKKYSWEKIAEDTIKLYESI